MITKNDIQVGKVYHINHKRKGRFYARVKKILPEDGDDLFLLFVEYDTRKGTDQERLRSSGNKRESNLRPTLIHSVRLVEDIFYDRTVTEPPVIESAVRESQPSMFNKLKNYFRKDGK